MRERNKHGSVGYAMLARGGVIFRSTINELVLANAKALVGYI